MINAAGLSFEMNKLLSALTVGLMASAALWANPAQAQIQPLGAAPPAAAQPKGSKTIAPDAPVPGNPDFKADSSQAQATAAPPPLPPAIWDVPNALDLLAAIGRAGADGLNPADYDPAGLQSAIQSGNPMLISAAATQRFNLLSNDLALGHVKKPARVDWFVTDNDLNAEKQDTLLRAALAQHSVSATLTALLPTHPQYAALKNALAATAADDAARRDRIRLNLDRWRWLPRDLGNKYIIVNVPGFYATLVEDGVNRWKQRAIAGKLSTPTPQLNATAVGVMLNPSWNVPKSIEKEAAGKKGFIPIKSADGKRVLYWQQPPGPTNALGQLKFVMPNSKAIYLHDTNARSRFNDSARALSHGCIRTQHIVDLATELLGDDNGTWTPDKVQAALDSKKSVQANFVKPLPVYIVYFSSAGLNDGRIVDYRDLYGRDAKALAALKMRDGGSSLASPDNDVATKPKPKPAQVANR